MIVMTFYSRDLAYPLKMIFLISVVYCMGFIIGYAGSKRDNFQLLLKFFLWMGILISGLVLWHAFSFFIFGELPSVPLIDYFPLPHEESLLHRAYIWYLPGILPRFTGTLAEPNSLGIYLAFVICISLWVLAFRQRLGFDNSLFRLSIFSILISALPLLLTFSRSGWITTIAGASIIFFMTPSRNAKWLLPLSVVVIIALTFIALTNPILLEVFLARLTIGDSMGHINVRLEALEYFKSAPILGIGFGNYGLEVDAPLGVSSTHSYYITYLVEGGILGFLVFLWFMLSLIGVYFGFSRGRIVRDPYWVLALVLSVMVFLNNIFYHTLWLEITWVVLGFAFAAGSIYLTNKNGVVLVRKR
ncbi:O-antigen ligase family protein, partial [Cardiobacterium sp. AH-315-I02]|nr:O-antigen ligase family protein [Cardiobacterium sp. AH-315-I02]